MIGASVNLQTTKENLAMLPVLLVLARNARKINRIHHWCPVGTEKSQREGPPFQ